MFPYRLAAIDLDDTLLGPDKLISDANARAVQRLRDNGVHVLLASGRRHGNMLHFHKQLDLRGAIVSCNGALAKEAESGEILHQQTMDAALAAEIIAEGDRRKVTQNYYHINDNLYIREQTGWTELYQHRTGSVMTVVGDMALSLAGDSPLKIIWIDEPEIVDTLLPEMQTRYEKRLNVLTTDPEFLEFMAPGVSKAVGIAAVAERYGIKQSEVVAFGDGNNDVAMLEWAGMGVAMAHGRATAKAAANRIAPDGDPETGLARAVQMLSESGL